MTVIGFVDSVDGIVAEGGAKLGLPGALLAATLFATIFVAPGCTGIVGSVICGGVT